MSEAAANAQKEWQLIKAAKAGDPQAVRELVLAYQDRLLAFLRRMVNNLQDAEDIAQESFVAALGALDRYQRQYRFSTWLYTIAYRRAVNFLKRRRAIPMERLDLQAAPDPDPLEQVAAADQAEVLQHHVWTHVAQLPVNQRAAIWLFYREQMSVGQIAEALQMPISTVKSHLFRARAALQEALAPLVAQLD